MFASFLAIVPILMAIASIMTTFLVVYGLTTFTDVSPIVQFLIALIGLGVAIDYSLLVVVRWREERAHGHEGDEAIVRAMETAGRAVVFSGTTVGIGLLALIVLPLPFLRSMGYGGMLIPLVSVLVAITLLPVVLHSWGAKLDWPHRRTDDKASRAWTRWAKGIVHRRWVPRRRSRWSCSCALVLAATNLHPGIADVNTIAKEGDAKDGLVALEQSGIGSGRTAAPRGARARQARPDECRYGRRVGGRHPRCRSPRRSRRGTRAGTSLVDAFPDSRRLVGRRGAISSTPCGTRHMPRDRACAWAASRPLEPRLHRRRLRQLPADDRADRGLHVRPAGARLPLAAAAR